ncbi:MAG: universal stress protein [Thermoleophilia bacterium]|nr:universal stress protein [Thermoleophilia bacterium]
MDTIVVGVDGSEGGMLALEVAVEEAALRKASLRVVTAWEMPPAVVAGFAYDSGYYQQTMAEAKQHAVDIATKALARVAELQSSLPCERRVVEGHHAKVILEEAKDAIRIVVGTRGHGGFTGLLLGSVSQQVVGHAHCPVLVVPPKAATTA